MTKLDTHALLLGSLTRALEGASSDQRHVLRGALGVVERGPWLKYEPRLGTLWVTEYREDMAGLFLLATDAGLTVFKDRKTLFRVDVEGCKLRAFDLAAGTSYHLPLLAVGRRDSCLAGSCAWAPPNDWRGARHSVLNLDMFLVDGHVKFRASAWANRRHHDAVLTFSEPPTFEGFEKFPGYATEIDPDEKINTTLHPDPGAYVKAVTESRSKAYWAEFAAGPLTPAERSSLKALGWDEAAALNARPPAPPASPGFNRDEEWAKRKATDEADAKAASVPFWDVVMPDGGLEGLVADETAVYAGSFDGLPPCSEDTRNALLALGFQVGKPRKSDGVSLVRPPAGWSHAVGEFGARFFDPEGRERVLLRLAGDGLDATALVYPV